jgi:hypothetical protein
MQYGHDYQHTFAYGRVETRVNGIGTAYAEVAFSVEWATKEKWGITINKHFFGSHAGQQARAWCVYLIAHPPSSWLPFSQSMAEEIKEVTA